MSIKDLKNRIKAVNSTKKITDVSKMIATSKFTQGERKLKNIKKSIQCLNEKINSISFFDNKVEAYNSNTVYKIFDIQSYVDTNEKANILFVFNSDKGLCGSINSSVIAELRKQETYKKLPYFDKTKKTIIIPIGLKAKQNQKLIQKNLEINGFTNVLFSDVVLVKSLTELSKSENAFNKISTIIKNVVNEFNVSVELDSIAMIFGDYVSMLRNDIRINNIF